MKIESIGGIYKLITDKPLAESISLPQADIRIYLESFITETTRKCPITTSIGWRQRKKEKPEGIWQAITATWLPVEEQVAVAENLGARRLKRIRWLAPGNVDEDQWAKDYKEAIEKREDNFCEALKREESHSEIYYYLESSTWRTR